MAPQSNEILPFDFPVAWLHTKAVYVSYSPGLCLLFDLLATLPIDSTHCKIGLLQFGQTF